MAYRLAGMLCPAFAGRRLCFAMGRAWPVRLAICYLMMMGPGAHGITLRELLNDPTPPDARVYKKIGGTELKLFIIHPAGVKAGEHRAAVLCIHGGAWVAGDAQTFLPHARYFASRGAVGVSVDYRLVQPGGPVLGDCLADCKSAMRYLREHADELGIDRERIAVLGDSAGGHLAACLGTVAGFDDPGDDQKVNAMANAMIPCNAIMDMTEGGWMKYVIGGAALAKHPDPAALVPTAAQVELARQLSPVFQVRAGAPAALVMHGLDDMVVTPEQSRRFQDAMVKAGNRCELFLLPHARHAFIVPRYTAAEGTVDRALLSADGFLVSLGYLSGKPTLERSTPPAWETPAPRGTHPVGAPASQAGPGTTGTGR